LETTHTQHTAAAYLLVGAWSVGEATVWPIMPDAVLVPLAFARPHDWWKLVAAAAGGTALGGAMTYIVGTRGIGRHGCAWHPPLVRPRMVAAVRRWLEVEGARGVRHQPASGVPFKVFAREAGALGIPFAPFLGLAVSARATRFALAAGGAALARSYLPRALAGHPRLLLTSWIVLFGIGLWRTLAAWSGSPDGAQASDDSAPGSPPEADR
jgi:membrane protein YqaA with SNARE-associated domain